jgi:hypothetical protein
MSKVTPPQIPSVTVTPSEPEFPKESFGCMIWKIRKRFILKVFPCRRV